MNMLHIVTKKLYYPLKSFWLCILYLLTTLSTQAQDLILGRQQITIEKNGQPILQSPTEGLWQIATTWKDQWPSDWKYGKIDSTQVNGPWTICYGSINLPQGKWIVQDAYKKEKHRIKVVRRYEWTGTNSLDSVTLAITWNTTSNSKAQGFLPGILYYGNPSGERNGSEKVPVYHGIEGEKAIFEEHRFTMPFASLEWLQNDNTVYQAALHSLPSPTPAAQHSDQYWSLGIEAHKDHASLTLLSGPISYNNKPSYAKALQTSGMAYPNTFLKVKPKQIIEKTFYIEVQNDATKGASFQQSIYTSIDIFKPFYIDDLPKYDEIIEAKYRFTKSRYMDTANYAGFNMYPSYITPQIVLGWAGQSEAPTFSLQVLENSLKDGQIKNMVQKSLDFITTSPFNEHGFHVIYNTKENKWSGQDPVSQGQAANSIALAILEAEQSRSYNHTRWKTFLKNACDIYASKILATKWNPHNTAESFYIAPLLHAHKIFGNSNYKKAALKIAQYYANRHITMEEPYWGGTLDATCEDKEGAWGAFQGFLTAYEYTGETKYLQWAKHAGDITLSYTVIWDIPLPAGRLADHHFKTRGWTAVSPQNQHLDVYGVLIAPSIYKLGDYTQIESLKKIAKVMYLSCGQIIDPYGSQGEQIQQTNFAQHGDMSDVYKLRGGYSEGWTVFWITAHFLQAAAEFAKMNVSL